MTRVGRRLIEDFLLPSLNDQRYGDRLMWVDKDKLLFSIRWSHKNAAKWSLDDTVVFQDWDKMKGHFHPEMKGYYMQSKQRFRAALYKLNTVRKLRMDDNKHTKMYQLVLENDKKRNTNFSGKLIVKQRNIQNNRPSVICRNTNYIERKRNTSTNTQNLQINENSTFSMDSAAAYSDNSSNSEDHCSSISSPNTAVPNAHKMCEPIKMLRPEDIKKENVELKNYSHAILYPQVQPHNNTEGIKLKTKYVEVSGSEFSTEKPYLLTYKYKLQPMVVASSNATPIFSVPNLQHGLTQMPLDVKHRKSPNRHLPVLPIPMYSKETVQKLASRKMDLSQPVDLSIKRELCRHVNIPVSARHGSGIFFLRCQA